MTTWRPRIFILAIALVAACYATVRHYNDVKMTQETMSLYGRTLSAFNDSNTALMSVDFSQDANRIAQTNEAADKMFGYSAGELQGRDLGDLLPEPFRELHRARMTESFEQAKAGKAHVATMRCIGVKKDGNPVDVFVRVFVTKEGAIALISLSSEIRHTVMGVNGAVPIATPVMPAIEKEPPKK